MITHPERLNCSMVGIFFSRTQSWQQNRLLHECYRQKVLDPNGTKGTFRAKSEVRGTVHMRASQGMDPERNHRNGGPPVSPWSLCASQLRWRMYLTLGHMRHLCSWPKHRDIWCMIYEWYRNIWVCWVWTVTGGVPGPEECFKTADVDGGQWKCGCCDSETTSVRRVFFHCPLSHRSMQHQPSKQEPDHKPEIFTWLQGRSRRPHGCFHI